MEIHNTDSRVRVAIYTRVSTEEQVDGHSLSAQIELVQQYASQRGWDIVHIYEERGRSGKTALRPEFQRMLRAAEARLFDIVVVHKLDRFSRSLQDVLHYLGHLDKQGVSLISISENRDFTTPIGRLMLAMFAALAEWYVNNLSDETSKGKRERARKGSWNGTLPFGYTTPRRLKQMLLDLGSDFEAGGVDEAEYSEKAAIIEDLLEQTTGRYQDTDALVCPFTSPGLRLAFEQYSSGLYSDTEIAALLTRNGYRTNGQFGSNPFGKDTITHLLQNRFYLGETSYQGKKKGATKQTIAGRHEPLISQELFDKCQEMRAKRAGAWSRGSQNKVAVYPLSSLLVCRGCGSRLRGATLHGERRYRDPAKDRGVVCPTEIKSMSAERIETQAAEILLSLIIPGDWRERVMERILKESPDYAGLKKQHTFLQGQLERLKKLFVMDDLSEKDYRKQRDALQTQIDALPLPARGRLIDLEQATDLLNNVQGMWDAATLKERETWFKLMFSRILVYDGQIESVEPTPLLLALLETVDSLDARWFWEGNRLNRAAEHDGTTDPAP